MSESLTNQFISDEYVNLLHVANVPLSSGRLAPVFDGEGNRSSLSLKLSGGGASITGSLTSGNLIFPVLPNPTRLIDYIFPIGSVYFTTTNTSPSAFLGGGWTQISQGRFIAGIGTGTDQNSVQKTIVAGNNNGEYSHRLTVSEMPSHTHTITLVQGSQDDDNARGTNLGTSNRTVRQINEITPSLRANNAGGGTTHNVTNPSFGLYIWSRTS